MLDHLNTIVAGVGNGMIPLLQFYTIILNSSLMSDYLYPIRLFESNPNRQTASGLLAVIFRFLCTARGF